MSEELIRRSDAIDAIHSYWKGEINKLPVTDSEYGEVIKEDCNTILKHNKELSTRIKAIPTTDRPQGEWIRDGHHIRCNSCWMCMCDKDREGGKIPQRFCPNCGARMKGTDDDSGNID